jgi:hypothetical protein
MKMKSFIVAAMVAAVMLFAGCATNGSQQLSPAQIASVACPQFNVAVTQLKAFNAVLVANPATNSIGAKATNDLAKAQKWVDPVCAAGATVTSTNLQSLAQQGLPALAAIVGALPLPPAQQAQIQGALVLAETAVGVVGVVEAQIQAAKTAPASSATAAVPAG